ncbi:MAG: transposase [Pseudomonadota bacterium]
MPRKSRIAVANLPHHIVQRGHRRNAVFFNDVDRNDYLGTLAECRAALQLKIYAYCLMSNHVHLVVDPGDDATNISTLMKRAAGRHSRRLNSRNAWSGSLWESRFKCSPIDSDRYLLACCRYVDQNPVRAKLVSRPQEYRWSSYRARAGLTSCAFLDIDPVLFALAATPERRHELYKKLAAAPVDDSELQMIRGSVQRNQLTGEEDFVEAVDRKFGMRVSNRMRGRPRKKR